MQLHRRAGPTLPKSIVFRSRCIGPLSSAVARSCCGRCWRCSRRCPAAFRLSTGGADLRDRRRRGRGDLGRTTRLRRAALRQPPEVWALGVGGLFGYHALYFTALKTAPPAEAGLINYLWPLLIVLLSALLPDERLRLHHVVGALLGLVGTVVLFTGGRALTLAAEYVPGFAAAFVAAFVWAIYSVLSRRFAAVPTDAVVGFCLAYGGAIGDLPSPVRGHGVAGDCPRVAGRRGPRYRPGRRGLLRLGFRRQARRYPRARALPPTWRRCSRPPFWWRPVSPRPPGRWRLPPP